MLNAPSTRRRFLRDAGLGFGSLALASLLHQEQARGDGPRVVHFPVRARFIDVD